MKALVMSETTTTYSKALPLAESQKKASPVAEVVTPVAADSGATKVAAGSEPAGAACTAASVGDARSRSANPARIAVKSRLVFVLCIRNQGMRRSIG
jgi:hypothetical protein